ncbi:hypothetical protein F2P81_022619 [Scophthalmus maximus]|uniref:Uncharacterized protein n=1 Tax=Scophthalmus maximus TaxID=52904 RepID=A0A6A4S0T0_SCOMX|nr:hypothetical protein F2P81_022619 [Scophthalmus maximus]
MRNNDGSVCRPGGCREGSRRWTNAGNLSVDNQPPRTERVGRRIRQPRLFFERRPDRDESSYSLMEERDMMGI